MMTAIDKAFEFLDGAHATVREAVKEIEQLRTDAARYRFIRDDNDWHQNDRYWEALSAGGEKLDTTIDDGIKSRAESEEEEL